jgi:predicted O-methyltransferase YrrM
MLLIELKAELEKKLTSPVQSHVFLDRFRLIEEESRGSVAYNDPRYVPFYYWLGTLIEPESVLEVGFRLGLCSGCFLKGCRTVEYFSGFQRKTDEFWSSRLGRANIRDNYKGETYIHYGHWNEDKWQEKFESAKWDLVIVNEEVGYDEHRLYLESVWPNLNEGGLVTMDYVIRHQPASQAYADFCKAVNRPETKIATRYGVGLIQK